MTTIDNGSRVRLVIPGLFDGFAGRSGDMLAFVSTRRLQRTCAATVDGEAVQLAVATPAGYDPRTRPLLEARIIAGVDASVDASAQPSRS